MNPSTHPIHPTTSTSTHERATVDGSTIEDIRHNLAAAEHDIAGIPYTPPEAVIRWAKPLAAMARTLLNAHDNTTETTDQSRPVVGLVARVQDDDEPMLSDLDTVAHARTQAVAAARHALMALRELLGVDPAVMSHGTQVRAGCVVDDLGQMGDRIRAFLLDDAPVLVAEVRQLRDQLAEFEAARAADSATIGVLAAAVAKVAALHVDDGDGWCKACQTLGYPCPTVLALGAGR